MAIDVSARIARTILQLAAARGADARALAAAVGFEPATADDADATIDIAVENALWDAAAAAVGDPHFGLHAAAFVKPGAFDVLDYAVRTAPTVRAALERLVRYNRLVHSAAEFRVEDRGPRVRIEHAFAVPGAHPGRQASEFTLASLIAIAGQIAGVTIRPLAVALPHAVPGDDLAPYEAVFGVRPAARAEVGAVELAGADVDRPCPAADPLLSEVILRQANALLAARPRPTASYGDRVRRYLVDHLGESGVSLASAARALKLSERSLQRRLADEGTTFDVLVDELRRELALRYLADRSLAIGEVAYLLGYSEPSAFHRAFKRWTGSTPAEARAS